MLLYCVVRCSDCIVLAVDGRQYHLVRFVGRLCKDFMIFGQAVGRIPKPSFRSSWQVVSTEKPTN